MNTGAREINARAGMYLEMETLVIVRESNYWGGGKTVEEAKANYRKAGKHPASAAAVISTFVGKPEEIERITIDDFDGTISYPKTVIKQ